MIVGITGMPGSGKSEATEVAKSLCLSTFRMGDVIWDEAEARRIDKTPSAIGTLMLKLRREEGEDVVAKRCLQKIKGDAVVEGIRSLDELNYFRQHSDLVLVAVHASPKTRYSRLLKRGRPDDPKDWPTFLERDLRELRVGLGSVIALADHMLINEGPLDDLQRAARKVFEGIGFGCKSGSRV